jgi:Mrp family chromosome partitioning ATPase
VEKLRDAINKARARREAGMGERSAAPAPTPRAGTGTIPTGAVSSPDPRPSASPATDHGGIDAAWAELAGFEPRISALRRSRIPVDSNDPGFPVIDLMRTKVIQQVRANGWKRLLITSPTPGCGKTTLTCALALSFARQRDFHVVFCEIDLRRPAMAATLGYRPPEPRQGFSDVLDRRSAFRDEAVRIGASVALTMNQAPVRNPSALILGNQVGDVIADIEARYRPDLMIFDSPPMLASDDTLGFLQHVDSALIIAAAELTTVQQVDQCERELAAQTGVMGTILNKCRFVEKEYGYGEAY